MPDDQMREQPKQHHFVPRIPESDVKSGAAYGGRAGWFRVAGGFSALAAFGLAYQSLSITRPSADATVLYVPSLAVAVALGAVLLAAASFLAFQHRPRAGLLLLLGYVIPTSTLYALQGDVVPPSLLLIASMFALILATRRRNAPTNPAA